MKKTFLSLLSLGVMSMTSLAGIFVNGGTTTVTGTQSALTGTDGSIGLQAQANHNTQNNGTITGGTFNGAVNGTVTTSGSSTFAAKTQFGLIQPPQLFNYKPSAIHSFGDSITWGYNTSLPGTPQNPYPYPFIIGNDLGVPTSNFGIPGAMTAELTDREIFPNERPLSTGTNPAYTVMIGYNESQTKGVGAYEAVYNLQVLASLDWLAIPDGLKVTGTSATLTGTWTVDRQFNSYAAGGTSPNACEASTTQGSGMTMSIVSTGGPLYLWYRLIDSNGGQFTYTVDGTSQSVNSYTTPPMATQLAGTYGVGVVRTPVLSGTHTVTVNVTSATSGTNIVSILAVGTAPLPGYMTNEVFCSNITPMERFTNFASTQQYSADALADVQQTQADGLNVWFVDVYPYFGDAAGKTMDGTHPTQYGHYYLAEAFEVLMRQYLQFSNPLPGNATMPVNMLNTYKDQITATGTSTAGFTAMDTVAFSGMRNFFEQLWSSNMWPNLFASDYVQQDNNSVANNPLVFGGMSEMSGTSVATNSNIFYYAWATSYGSYGAFFAGGSGGSQSGPGFEYYPPFKFYGGYNNNSWTIYFVDMIPSSPAGFIDGLAFYQGNGSTYAEIDRTGTTGVTTADGRPASGSASFHLAVTGTIPNYHWVASTLTYDGTLGLQFTCTDLSGTFSQTVQGTASDSMAISTADPFGIHYRQDIKASGDPEYVQYYALVSGSQTNLQQTTFWNTYKLSIGRFTNPTASTTVYTGTNTVPNLPYEPYPAIYNSSTSGTSYFEVGGLNGPHYAPMTTGTVQ
jgi:hypothetical protein